MDSKESDSSSAANELKQENKMQPATNYLIVLIDPVVAPRCQNVAGSISCVEKSREAHKLATLICAQRVWACTLVRLCVARR